MLLSHRLSPVRHGGSNIPSWEEEGWVLRYKIKRPATNPSPHLFHSNPGYFCEIKPLSPFEANASLFIISVFCFPQLLNEYLYSSERNRTIIKSSPISNAETPDFLPLALEYGFILSLKFRCIQSLLHPDGTEPGDAWLKFRNLSSFQ